MVLPDSQSGDFTEIAVDNSQVPFVKYPVITEHILHAPAKAVVWNGITRKPVEYMTVFHTRDFQILTAVEFHFSIFF